MIILHKVIGNKQGLLSSEGRKVYKRMVKVYKNSKPLVISFREMESATMSFINRSIGCFYMKYGNVPIEFIDLDTFGKSADIIKFKIQRSKELGLDKDKRDSHNQLLRNLLEEM